MKDINEKISLLCDAVEKERCRFSSSLKRSIAFYVVIIVIIAGYSAILNSRLEELATPKNVSILIQDMAAKKLPLVREEFKTQMKPYAKNIAQKMVKSVPELIPKIENIAKAHIDVLVDRTLEENEKQHMPAIRAAFVKAFDKVNAHSDVQNNPNIGRELASVVADEIDKELDNIFDNYFYDSLDRFNKELSVVINKPAKDLTCREYSERKVLLYWLFLLEYNETGEGIFEDAMTLMKIVWNSEE